MKKRVLFSLICMPSFVFAADVVIPSGTTQTTTETLPNAGDTLFVEEGGAIVTTDPVPGTSAVIMNNIDQTVTNYGLLQASNITAVPVIAANSNQGTIVNNGKVIASGGYNPTPPFLTENATVVGMDVQASNFSIINTGEVRVTNTPLINNSDQMSLYGIRAKNSDNFRLINSGLIEVISSGNIGHFLSLFSEGVTALSAPGAYIHNQSSGRIIANTSSSANYYSGGVFIDSFSPDAIIRNEGLIQAIGNNFNSVAVTARSDRIKIINSGIIDGSQAYCALTFLSNPIDPLLRILPGSNIQGRVFSNSRLNYTVDPFNSVGLTLLDDGVYGPSAGFGTLSIEDPYVHVGNTIVVLDPRWLALPIDMVADLTDGILNNIYSCKYTCLSKACGPSHLWLSGFGSYRTRDLDFNYNIGQGGVMAGWNAGFWDALGFTLFVGGSWGNGTLDDDTQNLDLNTQFAGVASQTFYRGTFYGASVVAGHVNYASARDFYYNLAPGGYENPKGITEGYFIAPELTALRDLWVFNDGKLQVEGTIRYAHLGLDGFVEDETTFPLSIGDSSVDVLTAKMQLNLPYFSPKGVCMMPYLGGAGRFQFAGNAYNAYLLGQALSIDLDFPQNIAEILVGLQLSKCIRNVNLFAYIEGLADNKQGKRVLGELRLGYRF